MSAPRNSTRPEVFVNPVRPSMKLVLPAPFGPIRPTISPSRTSSVTPSTARSPPYVTLRLVCPQPKPTEGPVGVERRACRGAQRWRQRLRPAPMVRAALACGRRSQALLRRELPHLPVGAGDPDRVRDSHEDEPDAGQERVVGPEVEQPVREDEAHPERSEETTDHGARHARDAAEVRKGNEADVHERRERVGGELVAAVADQAAGNSCEERRHAECEQLARGDVDADARGCALVAAEGEEPAARRAADEVRHASATITSTTRTITPNCHRAMFRPVANAQIDAEQ